MQQTLILTVLPTSTNHSHIHTRSGLTFPSAKTKEFKNHVTEECLKQKIQVFEGWLRYDVTFSFGRFKNMKWKPSDSSNRLKQLEDSLNGIAWIDDEQVVEGSFHRVFEETTYCRLTISTIEDGNDRRLGEERPGAPTEGRRVRGNGVQGI